jgi:hypothetical protein
MSNVELTPIVYLKAYLDKALGKDVWIDLEVETLITALDLPFSDLLHDKLYVLKIICLDTDLFYEDFAFTLYATEVMNNKVADFDSIPSVTSLELAYALTQMSMLLAGMGKLPDESGIVAGVEYMLRGEGYSEPVYPFGFVPKDVLTSGQTKEDSDDKKTAIELYIAKMNKGVQ